MLEIRQIKLPVNHGDNAIRAYIECSIEFGKLFGKEMPGYSIEIVRKSIDARKKPELFYIYSVRLIFNTPKAISIEKRIIANNGRKKGAKRLDMAIVTPERYMIPAYTGNSDSALRRPVVIGTGPAGLFCAYILAKAGLKPLLFERGESVEDRTKTVADFWKYNKLSETSNVQFGEGGAGTFSDGKLNTLTRDNNGRQTFVLDTFVSFGASDRIKYDSKPHIGTDVLVKIVSSMRNDIIANGGEVSFNSQVTDIICSNDRVTGLTINDKEIIEADNIVLATGHSARDTFEMLVNKNVDMQPKSFAVGFRVTHPQNMINLSQYGDNYPEHMEAAPYKLANTASNGRRVYSFCMCPGGYVVNASSENSRLCVNGMSYSGRDSEYANSAIIIGVDPSDFHSYDGQVFEGPLAGMYYQRQIEEKAHSLGNGFIPAQKFFDFEEHINAKSQVGNSYDGNCQNTDYDNFNKSDCDVAGAKESPDVKGLISEADLSSIYFDDMNIAFVESMHAFGRKIKGFDSDKAMLYGVEARTSSPVRINRNDNYESNILGLYPCGEGAGYAGGIMSAAVDGIKVAEAIIAKYNE